MYSFDFESLQYIKYILVIDNIPSESRLDSNQITKVVVVLRIFVVFY